MPVATVWALAQAWYRDRLDPTFRGRSPDQAAAILGSVGLVGPFWSLDR